MGLFDSVGSVFNTVGSAAKSLGGDGVLNRASQLAGALNSLGNPANVVSAIRSMSIPRGANPTYKPSLAKASIGGDSSDWRVRLSMPQIDEFSNSPVLKPLVNAGGLVFPFTPTIQLAGNATYESTAPTHNNYSYFNYVNSAASSITISGPFNVEDALQGEYWLAAVHYLRSITKMFTGESANAGNPPPMVYLNGYGDYVFKNIPVVVTGFTVELPQDVAYIGVSVGEGRPSSGFGSAGGSGGQTIESASALVGTIGGVAGALGKSALAGKLGVASGLMNLASNTSNMVKQAAGLGANPYSTGSKSHVPVKSTISVTCQPIWSRQKVRKFNLDDFVQGKYVNDKPGYL